MATKDFRLRRYVAAFLVILSFNSICCEEEEDKKKTEVVATEERGHPAIIITILSHPGECERSSKIGDMLRVHYTGEVDGGKAFESTYDLEQPYEFQLGAGQVIQGWEIGLEDTCVGETRNFSVPYSRGYGEQGTDGIPGKATLNYVVELLSIEDGPETPDVFKDIDTNYDHFLSREELEEHRKLLQEKKARRKVEPPAGSGLDLTIDEVFKFEDLNRDGYISHAEFQGPKHNLTKHDEL